MLTVGHVDIDYSFPLRLNAVIELNTKITDFLTIHGKAFSKDQWLEGYPRPTETKKTHRDSFFPIRLFAYSSGQTPKIEKGRFASRPTFSP